MPPAFRTASLLARLLLVLLATLGLLAIAWRWHPGPFSASHFAGSSPALAGGPPQAFILPAPPAVHSYLDLPERPDTVGETAPPEAQPPGLLPTAAPRLVTAATPPTLSAATWLVMDEGSGQVLFAHHGHRRRAPASVTKIMTALLAVERGNLDQEVIADVLGASIPDSTLVYLVPGDRLTLRDLMYGLLLFSGNDAAVQISHTVGGSEAAFVARMNERTQQLGLHDTHFANPHGLDQDGHFSSAYDLAALARFAMSYPEFATIVKAKDWRVQGPPSYGMYNGNRLLSEYPGADGVKIGNTDLAGQTIVASATRDGHRVYAVVLDSRDRTADSERLLDYVFANYRWN